MIHNVRRSPPPRSTIAKAVSRPPCAENVRVKRIKGVDATLKTMFVFARALPDGSETLLIETGSAALTAKSFISSKAAKFLIINLATLPTAGLLPASVPSCSPTCAIVRPRLAGFCAGVAVL